MIVSRATKKQDQRSRKRPAPPSGDGVAAADLPEDLAARRWLERLLTHGERASSADPVDNGRPSA